jgi:hypothetical protein
MSDLFMMPITLNLWETEALDVHYYLRWNPAPSPYQFNMIRDISRKLQENIDKGPYLPTT